MNFRKNASQLHQADLNLLNQRGGGDTCRRSRREKTQKKLCLCSVVVQRVLPPVLEAGDVREKNTESQSLIVRI